MKIAQTIPGLEEGFSANPVKDNFPNLGVFVSDLLNIIFYISVFLAFYYLIWAAFSYILAKGQKEDLAKARARITWALIGLVVIFVAFFIAKFAAEIFPTRGGLPF